MPRRTLFQLENQGSKVRDISNKESHTFEYETSSGRIGNIEKVHKFGGLLDLSFTAITPVASTGFYRMPTTLTSLEIVSDNVNDTSAGTGARVVRVEGITTGWVNMVELITMNGTTPVALSNQYYRVQRLLIFDSGTYADQDNASHDGIITVQETGAGPVWAEIGIENTFGSGQSTIAYYTSPINSFLYLTHKVFNVEGGKPANIYLYVREEADNITAPFSGMRILEYERNQEGHHETVFQYPFGPFIGPCDIGFMAISSSAALTDLSIEFTILIEHVNG